MKWTMTGADRDDGSDVTIVVEAATEADAITRANSRGVLVSAIMPVSIKSSAGGGAAVPTESAGPRRRVPCPTCAELVATDATLCPFCRRPIFSQNRGANVVIAIVASIALFLILFYAISAFVQHEADKDFRRIMNQSEQETDRLMRKYEVETTSQMERAKRDAQVEMDRMMRQVERDAEETLSKLKK